MDKAGCPNEPPGACPAPDEAAPDWVDAADWCACFPAAAASFVAGTVAEGAAGRDRKGLPSGALATLPAA